MTARVPITDSPWFWSLLFCVFALAMLTVFRGKYGDRQAQIERKFQAKEFSASAERPPAIDASGKTLPAPFEYSRPDRLIISLWPLAIFLVAAAGFSGVMVYRRLAANAECARKRASAMNWLGDSEVIIWAVGAIALTMAIIVFVQLRTNGALLGILAVVAVSALLLLVERVVETPREAVERTLYQLAKTVEANDVPGTVGFIAPAAAPRMRDDAQRLMPLVTIERARLMGSPDITVAPDEQSAEVRCRGLILATLKQSGMKGAAEDELNLTLVRSGDRWLVKDYTSKRNWNRAVGR